MDDQVHRYRLEIVIAATAATRLAARGERLVLAQPAGNAPPNLTWLVLPPVRQSTIAWSDACGLYAAVPAARGSPVAVHSAVYPALDGVLYPFGVDAFRAPLGAPIPARHYDVRNDAPFPLAFGLLQTATIGERTILAPVNAVVLPSGLRASFTPASRVYVWLQTAVAAGTVLAVPLGVRPIVLDPAGSSQLCRYDEDSALVVPV